MMSGLDTSRASPWIVRSRPNPGAALRLLCFPYAGGAAMVFRQWPERLPENVELLAVELPGRGARAKEAPMRVRAELVARMADELPMQAPFAIYGHSLGAVLGFALARELRRRGKPGPVHLFVSGRRAPELPEPAPMHQLPDAQFLERLKRLGGIPDAVLAHPELVEYFLPILRADITLVEEEPYRPEPPLECPITALGGDDDEKARLGELTAWGAHTAGAFEHEVFPGGHFFIQTARDVFLGSLSRRLSRVAAAL